MSAYPLPIQMIRAYCLREPILKLSLFGSALTDKFGPESDIDLLVEFEKNSGVGYLRMAAMECDLTDLIGRKVDLRTPGELSKYFRQEILNAAEPIYVKE